MGPMRRFSALGTLAQAASRRPRLPLLEQHCAELRAEEEELRCLWHLALEEKDFAFSKECSERLSGFWRDAAPRLLEQVAGLPPQDVFLELQSSEGGTDAMDWPPTLRESQSLRRLEVCHAG